MVVSGAHLITLLTVSTKKKPNKQTNKTLLTWATKCLYLVVFLLFGWRGYDQIFWVGTHKLKTSGVYLKFDRLSDAHPPTK